MGEVCLRENNGDDLSELRQDLELNDELKTYRPYTTTLYKLIIYDAHRYPDTNGASMQRYKRLLPVSPKPT